MKKLIKIILIILGSLIGISAISISIVSFDICEFQNTKTYATNSSRIIISDLNKTIFIGSSISWMNSLQIYLCEGNLSESYYSFSNLPDRNCSIYHLQTAVVNKNIIKNVELKLNGRELEVTENGFFCLGKRIRFPYFSLLLSATKMNSS